MMFFILSHVWIAAVWIKTLWNWKWVLEISPLIFAKSVFSSFSIISYTHTMTHDPTFLYFSPFKAPQNNPRPTLSPALNNLLSSISTLHMCMAVEPSSGARETIGGHTFQKEWSFLPQLLPNSSSFPVRNGGGRLEHTSPICAGILTRFGSPRTHAGNHSLCAFMNVITMAVQNFTCHGSRHPPALTSSLPLPCGFPQLWWWW